MMTLLIADDNKRIREMLKDMVSSFFSEVFECENGQQAYDLYSQYRPDWTLMDIEMPGMDGICTTRKIKSDYPEAKVIIVTGFDNDNFRGNAKQAGAMNYILKENSSEIINIIKQDKIN